MEPPRTDLCTAGGKQRGILGGDDPATSRQPSTGAAFPLPGFGARSSDPGERSRITAISAWAEERGCTDDWRRLAFDRWAEQAQPPPQCPGCQLQLADTIAPVLHRGLLSDVEASDLVQAAQKLEAELGNHRLANQGRKVWYSTSHETLYLHYAGWLSHQFPRLLDRLVRTMQHCAEIWQQQEPSAVRTEQHRNQAESAPCLNVRCIELHTYFVAGALTTPAHRDSGSTISMSVLLSDAATCDGGKFVTWSANQPILHELQRGDAILFPSERIHNVSPVLAGQRQSLVLELWAGPPLDRGRTISSVQHM